MELLTNGVATCQNTQVVTSSDEMSITPAQKSRFICSNANLYPTQKAFIIVLSNMNLTLEQFENEILAQTWFSNNNWWDNLEFMTVMQKTGLSLCKESLTIHST